MRWFYFRFGGYAADTWPTLREWRNAALTLCGCALTFTFPSAALWLAGCILSFGALMGILGWRRG